LAEAALRAEAEGRKEAAARGAHGVVQEERVGTAATAEALDTEVAETGKEAAVAWAVVAKAMEVGGEG